MKIVFTQGLPASGKSTWARKFCEENHDWVRINRDDLRRMRGQYWLPKDEKMITRWENAMIVTAVDMGKNIIIDATNLSDERNRTRMETLKAMTKKDIEMQTKRFNVDLKECIKRDLKREHSVGEKVIRDMYNRHNPKPEVIDTQDKTLPPCVIVDIDGTLAKMSDRSPYDWHRVGEDSLKQDTAALMAVLGSPKIENISPLIENSRVILFSGRDGSCRDETIEWLNKHDIYFDELHMRPAGNMEKDSKIKREMFETVVKDKYYCWLVLDDRNQVVDSWREMGLTCWQVAPGDF